MHIAYVSLDSGVPPFGCKGCSVHVQEMLRALLGQGHTVDLLTPRPEGERPADLDAVRVELLAAAPGAPRARSEQAASALNAPLRAALDLAESRGPRLELVYERYSLWSHAAMEWARAHGRAGVLEVNAPLIEEQRRHRGLRDELGAIESTRRALAAASTIIAVSDGVAAWARGLGAHPAKVHVVPNGVDPARFRAVRRTERVADSYAPFTVGFVGTLKPWHGVEVLLRAFALSRSGLAQDRLLIVGDGPERARLEALAAELGLTRGVEWLGAVPPAEVPLWLAAMDVAVAPYPPQPDFYFSPLKIFEYMAAGRPIVASRIGQIEEVLSHGVTGWLVPAGDAAALAEALLHLRAQPAVRRTLGRIAARQARLYHTWEKAARRILNYALTEAPNASRPALGAPVSNPLACAS